MGFRKDFVWGSATAAFQIEGAWNLDGKTESIWDVFCHEQGNIKDGSTGDIACNHYALYKQDVKLMAELGLKAYRFSISWARIIPDGTGKVNQAGIDFYNNLIDELLQYNITPYVTLYHWDLPHCLFLRGGWLNPESSAWFEYYTKVVAEHFGDRVKNFITFNEPSVFAGLGYSLGVHAPGLKLCKKDLLTVGHNVFLSHGKSVKAIRSIVADAKVGITLATNPAIPTSSEYEEASYADNFLCSKDNFVWSNSYWADTVILGKYPQELLDECADIMPKFTSQDMNLISQKLDFIGLNIYEAHYVGNNIKSQIGAAHTEVRWGVYDSALKWGVKHFYKRYNLPIYITENGISCHDWVSLDGKVHDPNRIDFLHRYLKGLKEASNEGCDVRGYFMWSFMDNFEWAEGYNPRFGMVFCDYNTLQRTPKDSAYWYKEVIQTNGATL